MFQVNRSENRLKKLEEKRFSDLNLREREHLQEWLAGQPDALGEELLIIQKEFDGFDGTRERLDLLALDKGGQLVVIENKLDDSGRDVTWQALKYAAYVSSLKKGQIVEIFQRYLDRNRIDGTAVEMICDFLEKGDLAEVVLNPGNKQRIVMVAANFRKEVTSTVLWLNNQGIRVQCFKVTPFAFGQELLLDVQQIIPAKEAEEFMIGMAEKESEETSAQGAQRRSHKLRFAFWEQALPAMRERGLNQYNNLSPSKETWINARSGVGGCYFNIIFLLTHARAELSLQRSDKAENKWLFDQLFARKDELEEAFGTELQWRRMDDKKASRIELEKPFDATDEDNWPEMTAWLGDHIQKFYAVFSEPLQNLEQEMPIFEVDS